MQGSRVCWSNLASSRRWRGVVSFIRDWVGPFNSAHGMAPEELDEVLRAKSLSLPTALREWYLLAAGWSQGGLNVWIRPQELAAADGMICILTDTDGITEWGIRAAEPDIEDPPVFFLQKTPEIDFQSFTSFVAAMIINDVIFASATDPVELNPGAACAGLTCIISSRVGNFYAEAALDAAPSVVMFAYPGNGPASGKSRTPAGHALLERFRLIST